MDLAVLNSVLACDREVAIIHSLRSRVSSRERDTCYYRSKCRRIFATHRIWPGSSQKEVSASQKRDKGGADGYNTTPSALIDCRFNSYKCLLSETTMKVSSLTASSLLAFLGTEQAWGSFLPLQDADRQLTTTTTCQDLVCQYARSMDDRHGSPTTHNLGTGIVQDSAGN